MSYLQQSPPMEPLRELCSAIPEWQKMLDKLNGEMDNRQAELAKAALEFRPANAAPSLRNKGSTESLRPADDPGNGIKDTDIEMTDGEQPRPTSATPRLMRNSTSPGPIRAGSRSKAGVAKKISTPVVRKRKTESLASIGSQKPKQRTRSMIIVYYDSAVQLAFEELVKHLSAARNTMRKGKLAEKMANMRQPIVAAPALTPDNDMLVAADDDDLEADNLAPVVSNAAAEKRGTVNVDQSLIPEDSGLTQLKYVSTRRMGPQGGAKPNIPTLAGQYSSDPMHRGVTAALASAAAAAPPEKGLYDELDKGLEWCQNMCEHAAHQFLRDGTCKTEIKGISTRLAEVVERARAEVERTKHLPPPAPVAAVPPSISRIQRPGRYQIPQFNVSKAPTLEADNMLVADDMLEADTLEADLLEADDMLEVDSPSDSSTKKAAKPQPTPLVLTADTPLQADDMLLEADDNLEADTSSSFHSRGPLRSGSNNLPHPLPQIPSSAAHANRVGAAYGAGPGGTQNGVVQRKGDTHGAQSGEIGWPGRGQNWTGMTGTRTLRNPALRKGPRMVNGRREVLEKDAVKVEEVVMKTEKLAVVHKVRSVPVIDFDNLEADSEDEAFGGKVVMRARSAIESDSSGYTAAASQLRRENERANEVKAGIY